MNFKISILHKPDVVSELPGVGAPAEEGRGGDQEAPHPAAHQQNPGQSHSAELTLAVRKETV